ncbi:ABC transporter substrate-binding protein [Prosthecomicrobium sp. N25]|uniref:ABC transporter substrate-binding protein n=1 Tax=Prosthecomicrobium sp. N25 TaxID=3129254 RepID=UPI003076D8C5
MSAPNCLSPSRRRVLGLGASLAATLATPAVVRAQSTKIRIGFWPIAGGLPLFAGVEAGVFKRAGLDVEAVKFASAAQVVEALIAGRLEGSANGTASAALALGDITSPGLLKIICANPSNKEFVLDEMLVAEGSPIKTIADLDGKKVACGPGIQNVTLAKIILEKNGIKDPKPIELPIGQHVAALAAGQVDAVYTLEPNGTLGRLKKLARILETGVISTYVLGETKAPWFGGSASVTTAFLSAQPALAKAYIAAYGDAVRLVRDKPDEARKFLSGYTSIEPELVGEVPLPGFTLYNEFSPSDIGYFQKFFDVFTDRGIFTRKVDLPGILYKA